MSPIHLRCTITACAALLFTLLLLAGCLPRTVNPLVTLEYDLAEGSDKLVVFLPGRGENIGRIKDRGLFEIFASRGYDVIVADLHLGYYIEGSFIKRLREDVLRPARHRGYKSIWLVGNSLGGNGALFYIKAHPGEIDGVILLGPFLGDKNIIEEIDSAGGVAAWEPGDIEERDFDRALWAWIRDMPDDTPPVFLCYGRRDRFSEAHGLLANVLPPGRTVSVNGGHDWKTWRHSWDILLSTDTGRSNLLLP